MSLDRLHRQALKAYEDKELPKARKLFEKILKINPEHLDAHYLLGTLLAQLGLPKKALVHLNTAARINPDSPMVLTNMGIIHLQANNYPDAEKCFQDSIALDSNQFQAHFNLAILFQQKQQIADAIDSYQFALKLEPNFFPALMCVAYLQLETGDFSSAEFNMRRAVSLQPDNVEALHLLSNILAQSGQLEPTREVYKRLLAINPDDSSARYVLNILNGETPKAPPRIHFEKIFNSLSGKFDAHLKELGYQGPERLLSLLQKIEITERKFNRLLDVGCGTGAVGQIFHTQTEYVLGIDIADKMLEHCRKTEFYNQLECTDIFELDKIHTDFDLVVAADVFPYLGDLNPVIKAIGERMIAGGYLLFTTERDQKSDRYFVDKLSGRYRFNDDYLKDIARQELFEIICMQIEPLRQEKGDWLEGHFCVWQKKM